MLGFYPYTELKVLNYPVVYIYGCGRRSEFMSSLRDLVDFELSLLFPSLILWTVQITSETRTQNENKKARNINSPRNGLKFHDTFSNFLLSLMQRRKPYFNEIFIQFLLLHKYLTLTAKASFICFSKPSVLMSAYYFTN